MLAEEVGKTDLLVGNEGSNLSGKVGKGAWDEGGIRESVVKWEEELGSSAILELSHQLDTSVLQLSHHLCWVVLFVGIWVSIEGLFNLSCGITARLIACGCGVSLIVLEGKAATEVDLTDSFTNCCGEVWLGSSLTVCCSDNCEGQNGNFHHLYIFKKKLYI